MLSAFPVAQRSTRTKNASLRDEGIAYYRRLQAAGGRATGRVNLGLTHAGELIFKTAVGDVHDATVADIPRFARSLAPAG